MHILYTVHRFIFFHPLDVWTVHSASTAAHGVNTNKERSLSGMAGVCSTFDNWISSIILITMITLTFQVVHHSHHVPSIVLV